MVVREHKINETKKHYLDFETKIAEIDENIVELERLYSKGILEGFEEIRKLEEKRIKELQCIYSNLTPWQIVNVARHPQRPIFKDYLENITDDFCELHGDRRFGDDKTLMAGFARIRHNRVMILGQNKGRTTEEKIKYNFGCMHPEGYRKALQKMRLAEKYELPILTFIDTPGAYPGVEAEERGQASAIAVNLKEMSNLKVPVLSIVIGEGGSGGALGIGVCDKLAMLEFSYYSVISPEGCAAILWRDAKYAKDAADSLKLTSKELYKLGLVDEIIQEPLGGAHRNYNETFANVRNYISKSLYDLKKISSRDLVARRYEKLRRAGSQYINV